MAMLRLRLAAGLGICIKVIAGRQERIFVLKIEETLWVFGWRQKQRQRKKGDKVNQEHVPQFMTCIGQECFYNLRGSSAATCNPKIAFSIVFDTNHRVRSPLVSFRVVTPTNNRQHGLRNVISY